MKLYYKNRGWTDCSTSCIIPKQDSLANINTSWEDIFLFVARNSELLGFVVLGQVLELEVSRLKRLWLKQKKNERSHWRCSLRCVGLETEVALIRWMVLILTCRNSVLSHPVAVAEQWVSSLVVGKAWKPSVAVFSLIHTLKLPFRFMYFIFCHGKELGNRVYCWEP